MMHKFLNRIIRYNSALGRPGVLFRLSNRVQVNLDNLKFLLCVGRVCPHDCVKRGWGERMRVVFSSSLFSCRRNLHDNYLGNILDGYTALVKLNIPKNTHLDIFMQRNYINSREISSYIKLSSNGFFSLFYPMVKHLRNQTTN